MQCGWAGTPCPLVLWPPGPHLPACPDAHLTGLLMQMLAELAARPAGALPRFPKLLYTVPVGQNPTGEACFWVACQMCAC